MATDGGAATVTVSGINIDKAGPRFAALGQSGRAAAHTAASGLPHYSSGRRHHVRRGLLSAQDVDGSRHDHDCNDQRDGGLTEH